MLCPATTTSSKNAALIVRASLGAAVSATSCAVYCQEGVYNTNHHLSRELSQLIVKEVEQRGGVCCDNSTLLSVGTAVCIVPNKVNMNI